MQPHCTLIPGPKFNGRLMRFLLSEMAVDNFVVSSDSGGSMRAELKGIPYLFAYNLTNKQ